MTYLVEGVSKFLQLKNRLDIGHRFSAFLFTSSVTPVFDNKPYSVDLAGSVAKYVTPNGRTNFEVAVAQIISLLDKTSQDTHIPVVILFLSDGQSSYPNSMGQLVTDVYSKRIKMFYTIGLGKDNFSVLQEMAKAMTIKGQFHHVQDVNNLVLRYAEIAKST